MQIAGWDNYDISECGVVTNTVTGKELHGQCNLKGYRQVLLCQYGASQIFSVHRLVAQAFIPNPDNLPQVNHKDRDKLNNSVDNLEWCTCQQNNEHSKSKSYKFLSPAGDVVDVFNIRKFSREHGLNHSHMVQVHKGNKPSHKGWTKA